MYKAKLFGAGRTGACALAAAKKKIKNSAAESIHVDARVLENRKLQQRGPADTL